MRGAGIKDQRASLPRRRSLRLKGASDVDAKGFRRVNSCPESQADGGSNSYIPKHVKAEVIHLEESSASSSMSGCCIGSATQNNDREHCHIGSVTENNDMEHCCNTGSECAEDEGNLQDISLKDLRAWCRAKKRKAPEISEVADTKTILHPDQSQGCNLQNVKLEEEIDLVAPLIAFKVKRPKSSPTTRYKTLDVESSSQSAVPIEEATLKKDKILCPAAQASSLVARVDDSTTEELQKRSDVNQDHSKMTVEEEFGKSSYLESSLFEHLSDELHQKTRRDHWNGEQSCFTNQPLEVAGISGKQISYILKVESSDDMVMQEKTTDMAYSEDFIQKPNHDQNPSDDPTIADMLWKVDSSSVMDEYSLDQPPDDYFETPVIWASGGVHDNVQGSVKSAGNVSPIDDQNSESVSAVVVIGPDLCGGTGRKCPSLEGIVQKQEEGQIDSLISHAREMSVHKNVEYTATDCTFLSSKMRDSVGTANFVARDGQLESIVCDAINNHAQLRTDETNSCVQASDSVRNHILLTDQFPTDCSSDATASPDGQNLLPDRIDLSSLGGKSLSIKMEGDACRSIYGQRSIEGFDPLSQFFLRCINVEKSDAVTCGSARNLSSSDSEETMKLSVGMSPSTGSSQEIDRHGEMSTELLFDEGSTKQEVPKKLLSKREIISPTSQEKLCKALTEIDLCDGVQRLKRSLSFEDCDKFRRASPRSGNKEEQSFLLTERTAKRPKSSNSSFPVVQGIVKSTETPSPCKVACSCTKGSPVHLDTEKAVEFSQRQMHDIENIATRLLRSLKHVKSIVDETLSSEAHSLLSNFSASEIRAASGDASEIERTTRKWLAIMTKDCNRFCKILTLGGKKAVPQPDVRKNRRKIIFADEAGRKLCHVKVFNEEPTSFSSECQKDC